LRGSRLKSIGRINVKILSKRRVRKFNLIKDRSKTKITNFNNKKQNSLKDKAKD